MKKTLLSLLCTLTVVLGLQLYYHNDIFDFISNQEIAVKHHDYITYYNPVLKEADSVSYNLTVSMVSCVDVPRKNPFKMDPDIPKSATPTDYAVNSSDPKSPSYNADRASWIDEGHLFSYQSAMCSPFGVYECFYMSNMLPQLHAFNAGDWKTLEVEERVLAKTHDLHIVAGGYGTLKTKLFPLGHLPNGENIPAYMWKCIQTKGNYMVFIMPNAEKSVGHPWTFWSVAIKSFDTQTIGNAINKLKI